MTPRPIPLGMTICEKLIVEEGTKNVTPVSCFTRLVDSEFPTPKKRLVLFTALKDGLGSGTIEIVLSRLDTDDVVYRRQVPSRFADRLQEVRIVFRMNECSFPVL
jgi:hypothetical protein